MANNYYGISINSGLEIFLNYIEIECRIQSILTSCNSISTSTGSVGDISKSRNIMLKEYVDRMKQLSDMLEQYQHLLKKDMEDVRIAVSVLNDADTQKARELAWIHNQTGIDIFKNNK